MLYGGPPTLFHEEELTRLDIRSRKGTQSCSWMAGGACDEGLMEELSRLQDNAGKPKASLLRLCLLAASAFALEVPT
ncbi:hypothetical protein CYMTET_49519 [Cymbomonas tetramitiformis]|uniref:Uncharacterized protein n=1 Tax=Cymbomonas tetramitiformis TaxID=36881 RepID=A0AAE0EVQ5_9CHLO|nr:hypothetical protein CYMTET_49519 [Cymbomonas tetramitiformis]